MSVDPQADSAAGAPPTGPSPHGATPPSGATLCPTTEKTDQHVKIHINEHIPTQTPSSTPSNKNLHGIQGPTLQLQAPRVHAYCWFFIMQLIRRDCNSPTSAMTSSSSCNFATAGVNNIVLPTPTEGTGYFEPLQVHRYCTQNADSPALLTDMDCTRRLLPPISLKTHHAIACMPMRHDKLP